MTDGNTQPVAAGDVFDNIQILHESLFDEYDKIPIGLGSLARKMMLQGILIHYVYVLNEQKEALRRSIADQLKKDHHL